MVVAGVVPVALAVGIGSHLQSVLSRLIDAFGPFLIPVALFALGVLFYLALYLLGRTDDGG